MKRILAVLLLTVLISTAVNGLSLGVAPATLDFQQVLVNTEYPRQINVQRAPDDYDKHYVVSIYINSDWMEYDKEIHILPGETSKSARITLKVPRGTPLDKYTNTVEVRLTNCTGICPGINSNIKFEVTDIKTTETQVSWAVTKDIQQCEPFYIKTYARNYGNVPSKMRMVVDIKNRYNGATLRNFTKGFTIGAYNDIYFQPYFNRTCRWEAGYYTPYVKIYQKLNREWVLLYEKEPNFQVLPFSKQVTIQEQTIDVTDYNAYRKMINVFQLLDVDYEAE